MLGDRNQSIVNILQQPRCDMGNHHRGLKGHHLSRLGRRDMVRSAIKGSRFPRRVLFFILQLTLLCNPQSSSTLLEAIF